MGKTGWLGAESPTDGRAANGIIALAIMAMALHGAFVDFIPAPYLVGWPTATIFLVIGALQVIASGVYASRIGTLPQVLEGGVIRLLFLLVGGTVLFALMTWLVVAKSVPWGLTQSFGTPYAGNFVMQTDRSWSRHCDYRLQGAILERARPRYLCISRETYGRYPGQDVNARLVGKASVLGIVIQDAYLSARPQPVPAAASQ